MLIDRGADVDATSGGGFTPLHSAAQSGDQELVDMMLGAGAERAPRTAKAVTPGDLAEQQGHTIVGARLRSA